MTPPLLHPKKVYAITLNPEDKCQYYPKHYPDSWKNRLQTFKKNWSNRFVELFDLYETDYYVPIECSEPFRDGSQRECRLHFHGLIRFKTEEAVMQFLLCSHHVLMNFCNVKIDELNNPEEWIEYMEKHSYLPFGQISNVPPNYECYLEYFFPNQYLFLPEDSEELIET